MAESLLSLIEGLQRQMEALQGLEKEMKELRLENRELRTLLGPQEPKQKMSPLLSVARWSLAGQ